MEKSEGTVLASGLRQFIEDMGLLFEQDGYPRMAGRLAGWLLICDPPHQTAGELAEVLGASASSISGMTRMLVQTGLVKRVAVPGQRSACYRIRDRAWSEMMMSRWTEQARKARRLAEDGLQLLADRAPESRQRLEGLRDFHAFLEKEIPSLLEHWQKEKET